MMFVLVPCVYGSDDTGESVESLSVKLQQLHIALIYEGGIHRGQATAQIVRDYLPLLHIDPRTLPPTEKERRKGCALHKRKVKKVLRSKK